MAAMKKKLTLLTVFFTFFVDNLCWSIVFPIFAPLFIQPENHLFSLDETYSYRAIALGFFLMAFPLAQFFGAPILGEVADKTGRKKALILSIFITFLGLIWSAYSISQRELYGIFVSRLLTGLCSGNLSICMSAIADLSRDQKQKVRNFGYLALTAGFSFIIGTFLGGKLSDPSISRLFDFAFPIWVAVMLTFLNFIFVIFGFRETFPLDRNIKYDFLEGLHNIQKALRIPRLKVLYVILFLFLFGWNAVLQFSPVLLVKEFSFTSSQIGDFAAFMGVCWAFGAGVINRILTHRFCHFKMLEVLLVLFTVFCFSIAFIDRLVWLIIVVGLTVIVASMSWPICSGIISNLADKTIQGKILGMSQSITALSMALAPVIGGLVEPIYLGAPFLVGSFLCFIASLIYFRIRKDDRNIKIKTD